LEHEEHEGSKAHEGYKELSRDLEQTARIIVDAGLQVHRALGPGLIESVYEHCFAYELDRRGLAIRRQVPLQVIYAGVTLEAAYRLDIVVENSIIVEIKAVETLTRLHEAQLLTYLRLSNMRLGFLTNFNVTLFKNGLKRLVH
jgi:GxxExxY protein